MKRYLLFIISMLCVSIGAWAEEVTFGEGNSTYEVESDGSYTITVKKASDLSTFGWDSWPWKSATKIKLQVDGITMQSLCSVNELYNLTQNTSVTTIDFTNLNTTDLDYLKNNWGTVPDNFKNYFSNLIVPSSYASDFVTTTGKNVFSVSSTTLNAYIANVDNVNWSDVKGSCNTLSPYNFSGGGLSGCGFSTIDFTNTTITASTTVPAASTVYVNTTAEKALITGTDASNVKVPFPGTATVEAGGSLESNITTLLNNYDLHNTLADITTLTVTGELTSADVTWLNTKKSNLTGLTTLDLTGATFGAGVTKASVAAAVRTGVTVQYPASYTITGGCTVTIDMSKAMGDDLATILAAAKTALGSTNICTLIVTGEITNNDLIALGGTNMTGATRIDLSEATLASGATIDNIQLPTSLQQLVLPEDQTFSVGLKSKLRDATNLNYAYTPSSDCTATGPNQADKSNTATYKYDDEKNTIADYVWVNKAGGLAEALENEEQLRNSFYIKVASEVALTATDVNFNALTNKPTNYLFLDFSESSMTSTVADSYTVTDNIAYRIILPNNWSNDDLAHFQNNGNKGNLAAVYSYEDTKLNILVINDNSYWGTALQNPRIVRAGTNAIDILPGAYTNNHQFGTATTEGKGIITAINNANASIKSVYISIANTGNNAGTIYSIANSNITYLSFEGIKSAYNGGPTVNVAGCSKLQTLNLKDAVLSGVVANGITSLTTVDMTGTTNSGTTDLSGTGLRTFTTNSSTNFGGNLNLASTAITSFETQAKVTGDISLNACSSLTSLDISGTQFQNSSSKIHVHATDSESNDNVLSGLNNGTNKTILLPAPVNNVHFDKTRIHPNTDLEDNMEEVAASNSFEDDCTPKCRIVYDAEKKVATVYAYTESHFKTLMEKDNNYSKFADGTIFKFDASCVLNAEDLASVAGNTANGNYNKYYVDLYDLPATYDDTKDGETTTKGVITQAIDIMRANNWQYKGLLLPKAAQNIGTTLIMDCAEDETKLATCSQSIAYSGTIGTGENSKVLTASYIYKAANDYGIDYQARLLNLEKMMDLHDEIVTKTQYYSVSTNSATPLDLSTIPATATVNNINTSKLETVNNDMVTSTSNKPSIYAYPAYEGVMLDVMTSSGIGNTRNLELLMVDGPLTANDIKSVNNFNFGPRVLDLREAVVDGGITKGMLESITNANIEYIILPEGMTKEVVCDAAYSSSMTKLKAVISSSNTDLVAYVKQAGSLAEARYLTTGGSVTGKIFTPTPTGLQSVILAGSLNASDIAANTTDHYLDENGHWTTTSGNLKSVALWGEQGTITTIDLKDAVFAPQTDMNFSYAGLASLHDITLPTSKDMTLIPAECFMGITTFNDLCIPYNYTKIDDAALYGTYCGHITTTDANGAVIDNGEHSYTFSNNLEQIGTQPTTPDENGVHKLSRTVFPQNRGVTDVYVRAHKVPKCYANAFPANMLYGWGGFRGGDFPYCREKYENTPFDGSMIFTVLHFPDEASFTANKDQGGKTEENYATMKKLYTDVNKVYSKKEQTGAVDANGDPIAWPTFAELRRAYNQATDGITWNEWTLDKDATGEVVGGAQIPTAKSAIAAGPGTDKYTFSGYEGWHQFVLSMATYVEPAKTIENEVIKTNYVQGAWYTLCIPFSLTLDQAIEILGIPKSVEGKTENSLNGMKVEVDYLPDVRTLQTVTRTPGTTNTVTMKFTQNLLAEGVTRYWSINYSDPDQSNYSQGTSSGNSIAIRGGYPYLIRPYLPANEVVKNLGKYIMTRYGDKFEQARSCIYIDGCAQDLAVWSSSNKTGRFAKPFEGHKIQAVWDDNDQSTHKYRTHSNGKNYNYTFVGQFWDQKLPRYCFYMVENSSNTAGKWYRLASDKDYKWNQYKCVIMVTPENEETDAERSYLYTNSGKFRNNEHSIYPASTGTDAQGAYKFTDHLYIEFLNGLDDSDFEEEANARYVITFDDFIQEFDEDGNSTTAIESLDGETINKIPTDGKVYNLSGQLVGNSIDGLEKGMYIVNGKKYIVR